MSEPLTIKSRGTPDPPEYLDFELLRQEGLRHIQDLSGSIWTDHNVHDPGITILEVLCYALTDLDYRSKLNISDILARPIGDKNAPDDNFFTAAEILSNNPLSILDCRKLLIDIPGVRNAWLKIGEKDDGTEVITPFKGEVDIWIDQKNSRLRFNKDSIEVPAGATKDTPTEPPLLRINGLYKVYLELEPEAVIKLDDCGNRVDPTGDILAEVERRLQSHRNLCEDFVDIIVLKDERIGLCAEIELKADAFPDEVMVKIIEVAREFLSPTLPFYTLRQMIAMGKTPDEIFEGRPLFEQQNHGFIDPDELKRLDLRNEIHVSDLYGRLLKVPGIEAIRKLSLFNYSQSPPTGNDWILPLRPETRRPVLAVNESLQGITFYKRGIPFIANIPVVQAVLNKLPANPKKVLLTKKEDLDLIVPEGQYRDDLGEYHSIQHEFPLLYGIGADGLPDSVSTDRKAQALQLKGYLLFYDQLLANYLAQLANLRAVFSMQLDETSGATTFAGDLSSVPQLDQLIRNTRQFSNGDGFAEGEVIAQLEMPVFFTVPQDRDYALNQILTAFDNGTVVINTQASDEEGYFFTIPVEFGRVILMRSLKTFPSEDAAKAAFEQVRFLATLPESYEHIDHPSSGQYGFALIYRKVDYLAYLRKITESTERFYERKNLLFNHLLRRFAEDFTDYTLLTFALSRKQGQVPDMSEFNRRFARDKAAFLADYPNISRNRGRAFNYSTDTLHPDNISGLERRINRLIGITKRPSKKLNYFEVVPHEERYFFEYRDLEVVADDSEDKNKNTSKGTLLFRSYTGYATSEEAEAAGQIFVELAKKAENYLAEPCPVAYTYSFKVLDANGCEIAFHPETYGSASLRDEMMRYAQNVIIGNGLMHTIASNQGGWVFHLKKGADILLESASAAKKRPKALHDLHKAIEAARWQKNYTLLNEPLGRGYGFEVVSGNRILARHPQFYASAAARDVALSDVRHFIEDHNLPLEITQSPTRYRWQLRDQATHILLQSLHLFKSEQQTALAFLNAMEAAANDDNFKRKRTTSGKFTFELLQRRKHRVAHEAGEDAPGHGKPLPIGAPPEPFDTENALEQAIQTVIRLAKEFSHADISDWNDEKYNADLIRGILRRKRAEGHIEAVDGDFFAQLRMPGADTPLVLIAIVPSDTAVEAQIAFYEVLSAVRKGLFDDFTESGPNPFGFGIRDEKGNIIAEHPIRYKTDKDRRTGKKALSDLVATNIFDTDVVKIESEWWFEFWRKRCGKRLEMALKGTNCAKPEEAEAAWSDVLEILKAGNGKIKKSAQPPYTFWIEDGSGKRLAGHPKAYSTPDELGKAITELNGFVRKDNKKTGLDVPDNLTSVCVCTTADDKVISSNPYTWRVIDEEERIARNARRFPNKALAAQYAAALHRQYLCRQPKWSAIWTEQGNITGTGDQVRFVLRDAQQYYWQSVEAFSSGADAQKAFAEQYLDILGLARRPEVYEECALPDGKKVFRLINTSGEAVAESYPPVPADQDTAAERERLLDHARHYPIFRKNERFGFRLFDSIYGDTFWESLQEFDTPNEAMKGLRRFADLLLYDGNYQVVPVKCDWGLEIVEVLVESLPFFTSPRENTVTQIIARHQTEYEDEVFAWQTAAAYHSQYLNQLPAWTTARTEVEYQKDGTKLIIIRDSRQRYWKFPAPPDSDSLQYEALMIKILKLAQNENQNISLKQDEKVWKLELKGNPNEPPVAEACRHFKTEAQALAEKERLMAHARQFPIYQENGRFRFGVLDTDLKYLWKSDSDFGTVKEAMQAFRRFLNLLLYERNYGVRKNNNNKWQIEIEEELNNGISSEPCGNQPDPALAWTQVEQFLDTYSRMGASVFEEYTDYHHCCGYGLRIVGEGFRLARLSASFHTLTDRELARDLLFEQGTCGATNTDSADNDILNWLLSENISEQDPYITLRLAAVKAMRYADSYIVLSAKKGNTLQYRLGLIDTDGQPLLGFANDPFKPDEREEEEKKAAEERLFYKTYDKEEDVADIIRQHITAANRLPVEAESSTVFRFIHRVQTGTEQQPIKGLLADECTPKKFAMPVFSTQWESVYTYNQLNVLWAKYNRFIALLDDKNAYARANAGDGSPTLMIVDPDFELAFHPRTYTTQAEREIARQKLTDRLNTEGMHLIEHVLLRPRLTHEDDNIGFLMNVIIEPEYPEKPEVSGDGQFDNYIVGADPYSFVTTIILPYWPSRFRDNDFRDFFENTLRRESPAHVMPRIFWIRPQQMKEFEERYFCWLKSVGNDACTRPMIEVLQQLQNVFIEAFLYDCEGGGGNFITLNETYIN